MSTENNNVTVTNPSHPTAFKVFTPGHSLDEKRFMRRVCEVVEASVGMKAHSKWNTVAGARLRDGDITPVPGFNVLLSCEKKSDRFSVRSMFWTPETMLADGDFDVVTIPSHAKSLCVMDIHEADPVELVAQLLGAENVKTPAGWAEKLQKNQTRDAEKAQKRAAREVKKAENAQKRDEARAAVEARKALRAQKKLTPVVDVPVTESAPTDAEEEAAPVE